MPTRPRINKKELQQAVCVVWFYVQVAYAWNTTVSVPPMRKFQIHAGST